QPSDSRYAAASCSPRAPSSRFRCPLTDGESSCTMQPAWSAKHARLRVSTGSARNSASTQAPKGCVRPELFCNLDYRALQHQWSRISPDLSVVDGELLWQLELPCRKLLHIDILEREHPHRLHETIGAVHIP